MKKNISAESFPWFVAFFPAFRIPIQYRVCSVKSTWKWSHFHLDNDIIELHKSMAIWPPLHVAQISDWGGREKGF